jgi:hypothetical protein
MSTQTDPSRPAVGGSSSAADVGNGAPERAHAAAEQAQEQAQQAAGQAQDKVREQLDQRSTQLAERVHAQASDLRSVSAALRDQGKDRPAEGVDRLAGYAEQAGSYLRDNDTDAMLGDAEDFGRRKPAVVAAGALALGFVASRFLKASSRKRYSSTRDARQFPTSASKASSSNQAVPPTTFEPPSLAGLSGGPAGSGI